MINKQSSLVEAIRALLLVGTAGTQEEICSGLQAQGFEINQSKVSRMLRKLGAVKVKDDRGEVVYWLPKEPPPPQLSSRISSLIIDMVANETLVVIHTVPGSASLVARCLDYRHRETEILGTVAGDDTILIAPKSTNKIQQTLQEVKLLLS